MMNLSSAGEIAQPSLIVGLGPAGIRFLELIQQRLSVVASANVRCLGIRTAVASFARPQLSGIEPENLIEIPWDRNRARRLAESAGGYEWWLDNDTSAHAERLDSRMAFHVMRNFYRDGRIEAYLKRTMTELKIDLNNSNTLMLFIVSSLSDAESALIGELTFEILQQIGIKQIPIRLPCLMIGSEMDQSLSRQAWVTSALREIDRLTQKWQIFHRDVNDVVLEHELFNHALLLGDESYLPALADQLIGLVQKEAALKFSNDYGNLPSPVYFSMTVSRSWTYYVPVDQIRRACAARLLKEEVFESVSLSEGRLHALVNEFLEGSDPNRADWKLFRRLAGVIQRRKSSDFDTLIQHTENLSDEVFSEELCRFLNVKSMANPQDVIRFLEVLEKDLIVAIDEDVHMAGISTNIRLQLPALRAVIDSFSRVAFQRMNVWASLASQVEDQYAQTSRDLRSLRQATHSSQALLREPLGYNKQESAETSYYQELKERPDRWQLLIQEVHNLINWQWVKFKGQNPYLRCRIADTVYAEAPEMFSSLWRLTCRLLGQVAEFETIFSHLGHLSAQQINATLDAAPSSLQYDPLPASERRFHRYLISATDPMIYDWNIKPDIQICQTTDNKRLTYMVFEHNLPIKGLNFPSSTSRNIEGAFVFPNEQYAWKIESKMRLLKLDHVPFPAQFVRLMHSPAEFEIAMQCIFWGWFAHTANTHWQLDPNDGKEAISLESGSFPAMSVEDALLNFLIRIPLLDLSELHPLCHRNFPVTMARLRHGLVEQAKISSASRAEFRERLQEKIEFWKNSQKPFENGLAMYQSYLLILDRKKKLNHSPLQ